MLLNLFYWCTNQQIIQRTFGAKNLQEGQKGELICGAVKLLGPLYLVLPGIIAFHLYVGTDIKADTACGQLVRDVLPGAAYWAFRRGDGRGDPQLLQFRAQQHHHAF